MDHGPGRSQRTDCPHFRAAIVAQEVAMVIAAVVLFGSVALWFVEEIHRNGF